MRKISGRFGAAAGITALTGMTLAAAIAAPAQTYSVVYTFQGGTDGMLPEAGLALDGLGNFYGTTTFGGTFGLGTVFKISPSGSETILYNFTGGLDGGTPSAPRVKVQPQAFEPRKHAASRYQPWVNNKPAMAAAR